MLARASRESSLARRDRHSAQCEAPAEPFCPARDRFDDADDWLVAGREWFADTRERAGASFDAGDMLAQSGDGRNPASPSALPRRSGRGGRNLESEQILQHASSRLGHPHGAAALHTRDPARRQAMCQPGRPQRAADVRLTLRPVETASQERPALTAQCEHVDPTVGAAQGYYVAARDAGWFGRVMTLDLQQRYARIGAEDSDHVCTGNSIYRAEALARVGGLDESLGYGYDNDISYRLRDAGYRLVLCRAAKSVHGWREGLVGYCAQQYGFGYGRIDVVAKRPLK